MSNGTVRNSTRTLMKRMSLEEGCLIFSFFEFFPNGTPIYYNKFPVSTLYRLIVKYGPSTTLTVLSSQKLYPVRHEFLEKITKIHVFELRDVEKVSKYVFLANISMIEEVGWFYTAHRPCHNKAYTKTEYLDKQKLSPPISFRLHLIAYDV